MLKRKREKEKPWRKSFYCDDYELIRYARAARLLGLSIMATEYNTGTDAHPEYGWILTVSVTGER